MTRVGRPVVETPEETLAQAQIMELWRSAARCEGLAVTADMAAISADRRRDRITVRQAERASAFFRAHARALRQAGNLHMVLSRPTPEVFEPC